MILGPGPPPSTGLPVVLLKYRFDTIRLNLIVQGYPAWGRSSSNDVYDTIMYWNMLAFQTNWGGGIPVDGIYGPLTEARMQLLEAILGIHY